ncbi:MAG: terminase large subunit domain-containing protein [Polaromonas sp.]
MSDALATIITPQMRQLALDTNYKFDQRAPAVLLPYQQRWLADKSQVKVVEKSRRIGLSWAEACDSVLCAAAANGQDVWYIGYVKDMAIEFILDCAQWAEHFNSVAEAIDVSEELWLEGEEKKSVFAFSIKFASGNRITALSSKPRNLRGKQGRVILDEAAFHEAQGEILKAAMALLIWGGDLRIISTHDGDENPFNQLIKDTRAGRFPYSVHRFTFSEALTEGLYRRICLRTGEDWTVEGQAAWESKIRANYGDDAEEELDCVPKNGSGSFLTRELVEGQMRTGWPVLRYQQPPSFTFLPEQERIATVLGWCEEHLLPLLQALPKHETSCVGGDFARIGDLSAFAPLLQRQNLTRYVPFMIELRGIPFKQQLQILWCLIDHLHRFIGAGLDARGLGFQMAEETAQRYGPTRILMVQATQQWYLEHLPPYKAAFEDRMIELPMDADVLADHRVPKVVKGIPQIPDLRTADAQKKKRHGDTFIASSLAWFASRTLAGAADYAYDAAPARYSRWDLPAGNHDDDIAASQSGGW